MMTTNEMSCKLTSPELRQRKATVIASLKDKLISKKELPDGFAYQFPGTDEILEELNAFVKTERLCCSFFTFKIVAGNDETPIWLELTGQDGVKDFIRQELEF